MPALPTRPAVSLSRLAAVLILAAPALAAASPCAADALGPATVAATERQPLLRPLVVGGMAVTAVQRRDGERWLELAVDSPATAARLLQGRAGTVPRLERDARGAVLLACAALEAGSGGARMAALAPPLW
jgi:hypothetical protein